ncbi:MAG: acyl-CoA ligase (AMP-forming), exosortase A system-associated [Desulfobacteraceae bacterium]|nr:acyl-CoA ligase (AMP-forming), exosortase A system-associated [Desulfobacteraceae bacterium]
MAELLHELIFETAQKVPDREALVYQKSRLSYRELAAEVFGVAGMLLGLGLAKSERVAVYLEKRIETVTAMFGASAAGGVFVPVNPILKSEQVAYILKDCSVRILVTSADRLKLLSESLQDCRDLHTVLVVGNELPEVAGLDVLRWDGAMRDDGKRHRVINSDMAAILYTSGSTGKPKGVVLSHLNMVTGAKSVAQYLENTHEDRILSVLPLSFDYGFSQLTTAFHVGATTVLMNYLLPRDIVKAVEKERITGLAAVPPLWIQLAQLEWPVDMQLRYFTNSGGAMPLSTLKDLRARFPNASPYLMYGLTEAFRSTYLPPEEVDRRPDSIGRAIPNAEIMVVREDGSPCAPGEPGELVHRGALVSLGYWNDSEKTAERFKPAPNRESGLTMTEMAVWSGDTVRMDEEGYLYFISRRDEMIKTSGYRVSPTEVEEVIYATGMAGEVAAIGVPHQVLGQAIVVIVAAREGLSLDADALMAECKQRLPAYMVPNEIRRYPGSLPRNPNGKIDRKRLLNEILNC